MLKERRARILRQRREVYVKGVLGVVAGRLHLAIEIVPMIVGLQTVLKAFLVRSKLLSINNKEIVGVAMGMVQHQLYTTEIGKLLVTRFWLVPRKVIQHSRFCRIPEYTPFVRGAQKIAGVVETGLNSISYLESSK